MVLPTVRARWVEAGSYLNQPAPRCGHSAVAVASDTWGGEFVVRPPCWQLLVAAAC